LAERLAQNDAAIDGAADHAGELVEIDRLARRIDRDDLIEQLAEILAPFLGLARDLGPDVPVEQPVLIAEARDDATGMPARQRRHPFREQREANEEGLQRV